VHALYKYARQKVHLPTKIHPFLSEQEISNIFMIYGHVFCDLLEDDKTTTAIRRIGSN